MTTRKRLPPAEPELRLRPRPSEAVVLDIPVDTLESLKRVAEKRGMEPDALLRFYIGQGLRGDLDRLFADFVLEATATVLEQHLQSDVEVATILREIR